MFWRHLQGSPVAYKIVVWTTKLALRPRPSKTAVALSSCFSACAKSDSQSSITDAQDSSGVASYGALGHVLPYASLCSYKSRKAISHVKCVEDFAYHGY